MLTWIKIKNPKLWRIINSQICELAACDESSIKMYIY